MLDRRTSHGSNRGKVGTIGSVRTKAWRQLTAAGQHDVMAGRVIVGWMRQRSAEGPERAALSQQWQVLTYLKPGCRSRYRLELATNVLGAEGFMSKLSCCESPPDKKMKMQDLARPNERSPSESPAVAVRNPAR